MGFTSTAVKTAIAAGGIAAASVFGAATATAAPPTIQGFGTSEQLVDGPLVTNYTVGSLQPSTVMIPGYTPKGQLYQASITVRSDGGIVTPIVADFNARTADGMTYRVIDRVPTPSGLAPTPVTQGNQTSGTLYFDVTGPPPTNIVYNDGVQDVLVWTT